MSRSQISTRRLLAYLAAGLSIHARVAQAQQCCTSAQFTRYVAAPPHLTSLHLITRRHSRTIHLLTLLRADYPNGNKAPDTEKPCGSAKGSACCPDKWQCLDNGLCHYPPDNLYGRYSCTDPKWEADGCPRNLCTYDMRAGGGESITQCSNHNNDWCCNADATNVNCCQESPEPRPFFVLQDGRAYATVGSNQASDVPNIASITGIATSKKDGNKDKPSQTPAPSSSDDKPKSSESPSSPSSKTANPDSASPAPTTPSTSLETSITSGTAGISTIIITRTLDPASSEHSTSSPSPTSNNGSSKSNIPIVVGCAVGIPLALALIGILAWLLRKRARQNGEHKPLESPTLDPYSGESSGFAGGAKLTGAGAAGMTEKNRHFAGHYSNATSTAPLDPGVPELMGRNVGPGRPVSTIVGKAELDGGPGFAAGAAAPYAPDLVGVGGGNATNTGVTDGRTPNSSWGSAPPGYSPGMNAGAFAAGGVVHGQQHGGGYAGVPEGVAEAPDTSVPRRDGQTGAGVGAGAAPGAGNVTDGERYIPYRPPGANVPQAGGAGTASSNVPEGVAEMPSVRTPPA
ncbi:uncharacterized protein EI97DRAFT_444925 [Westerdykella ornata]|uniref:Mid2 domain-containing protein n=1 Tax=Westerdykella ornata TaxID=318751 RepID=A0A6A6JCP1_WESOR|nr:uncharacterized protein EI97DRAFT_444925 [Westerdykella ornata]KAF2273396.1 hypothetical protein EI97DRAFT_444925 [Westerdykella ornata]